MRVLLTHSYFLRFDQKQWKLMQPYAPLGTMYAAAALRGKGFEVKIHDVMFEEGPQSIEHALQTFKPDAFVICDDGFNYLTKMCLTNMREAAFEMSRLAKQHNIPVIVSSSDSTDHSDDYFNHQADFVIVGEVEQTLVELIDHLQRNDANYHTIDGLIYRVNDNVIRTTARRVMNALDELAMPGWDLVNIQRYKDAWIDSTGYFSINLSTTRGCPFKCNWCAKPIYGNRYNARTPENVVNELLFLKQRFNFDHVWFCDDIFGLKPGWVQRFASLVKENNLNLRFKIQSRVDLLLNDDQIQPLADAGCETVWVGAESGSQKILDAMDKGTTVQQIAEARGQLKKHGISVAFFLQFGYLGETKEDIEATLSMLEELKPDEIGISVSYPLPGTGFYDNVKEQLNDKSNWTDSDELALMFRNLHSSDFYKHLHKHVHNWYRTIRAREDISDDVKNGKVGVQTVSKMLKLPYYSFKARRSQRLLSQQT